MPCLRGRTGGWTPAALKGIVVVVAGALVHNFMLVSAFGLALLVT
jgi:hypothetical protein